MSAALRGSLQSPPKIPEILVEDSSTMSIIFSTQAGNRHDEGGIVCGDVVAYGWIDSVLEFKKQNNTRAHGRACEHACERVVRTCERVVRTCMFD